MFPRIHLSPAYCQISRVPTDKPNNGPSEFADMWKELKLKENSASGSSTDEHREPDDRGKETRESDTLIKVSILLFFLLLLIFCHAIK